LPAALVAMIAATAPAPGAERPGAEELLSQAFPRAAIVREAAFLTGAEIARAAELSGVEPPSALITRYVATAVADGGGTLLGTAYLDTHLVRTLPETLLVLVAPGGTIRRIEVLSFAEPAEYLPRAAWFEQFADRPLDADLALDRRIRPVVGASLSARAATAAARRVLAVHRVLGERSGR